MTFASINYHVCPGRNRFVREIVKAMEVTASPQGITLEVNRAGIGVKQLDKLIVRIGQRCRRVRQNLGD